MVTLEALLLAGSNPVANASISFFYSLGSTSAKQILIGSALTNSSGIASIQFTPTSSGIYTFTASFAGTDIYLGSMSMVMYDTNNPSKSTTIKCILIDSEINGNLSSSNGTPLSNQSIAIYLDGVLVATVTTDMMGNFSYTYSKPLTQSSTVSFSSTQNYLGSSDTFGGVGGGGIEKVFSLQELIGILIVSALAAVVATLLKRNK